MNSVILGDFEGGGRFDQQLISSWNIPRDCRKLPEQFGTLIHHGYGLTGDFMKTQKKNFLERPLLGSGFFL